MLEMMRGDIVIARGSSDLPVPAGTRLTVAGVAVDGRVALEDGSVGYGLFPCDESAFYPVAPRPGDTVRCAYRPGHIGVLLAFDDPRAWAGTAAFPGTSLDSLPAADMVSAHVERIRLRLRAESVEHAGAFATERRPVLWGFGRVMWDCRLVATTTEVES